MAIIIQEDRFSISKICAELSDKDNVGAIVSFSGHVREFAKDKQLKYLEIEHYPGMTESLLQEIVDQAAARWDLIGLTVIHRVGELLPSDQIVFVGVASQHRADAFEAAQFVMDYLKTKATFWKKVDQGDQQHWVESKDSDQTASQRWQTHD